MTNRAVCEFSGEPSQDCLGKVGYFSFRPSRSAYSQEFSAETAVEFLQLMASLGRNNEDSYDKRARGLLALALLACQGSVAEVGSVVVNVNLSCEFFFNSFSSFSFFWLGFWRISGSFRSFIDFRRISGEFLKFLPNFDSGTAESYRLFRVNLT